ncbi:TIGR01458 family HAD-type hydrolase [Methanoculleus sp. FWC-SCC1]|uniref:Haloacid dehalogenase-like hydrolase domain-containing protein 2 n=1 Tax=Methanoculleus frigidifontis TaxID=2584085 RepID=A0ABT8MAR5_9EURY|nr:TIGR01458 family HAD-type hydrolase [Methanoculleus sp. FWC-SCC1]MDN7025029.1 TIGR01458 family HAD-type hydrolase [Methanoculleus sp. FWC-SCC1]
MDVTALLIDIDGVLYVGDSPVAGADRTLAFLEEQGIAYRFVSNTTRRSRRSVAAKLAGLGYAVPEDLIVTSPVAAVARMQERGQSRCFLLATGDLCRDFEQGGIEVAEKDVDAVIVGDAGENFTYEKMNAAFRLLLEGADLIALEKDRYWMGSDGLQLSAGPFVAALEYAAGVRAEVMGKPSREFFTLALRQMGAEPGEAAMIGDDIFTDIGGARAAGLRGVLVKTGKYREEAVRRSGIRPDLVIGSMAALPEHLADGRR